MREKTKIKNRNSSHNYSNPNSKFRNLISNHKGITLVAMIITIIVMIILVAVSISIAINGGLFVIAKQVANNTENIKQEEEQIGNGKVKINGKLYDSIDEYLKPKYKQENLVLHLDAINNVKEGHSNDTDTWYDISGISGKNAIKDDGTTSWSDKSLILDGETRFTVDSPVNDSFGTMEVCLKIDKNFEPLNKSQWFECSAIFGCELSYVQRDRAIIIDKNRIFCCWL